jgi:hypothetical protein
MMMEMGTASFEGNVTLIAPFKNAWSARCRQLTPVILATWEAEIGKIEA